MHLFSYKLMHDNIIPEDKFTCKESKDFPVYWFERYPAEQGGDGIITYDGLEVMADSELNGLGIRLYHHHRNNPSKERRRKAIKAFFDILYGED